MNEMKILKEECKNMYCLMEDKYNKLCDSYTKLSGQIAKIAEQSFQIESSPFKVCKYIHNCFVPVQLIFKKSRMI